MKAAVLIQARMSSSRLPGKMLKLIGGMSLAEWVLQRCATSVESDMTALLTSELPEDDALADVCLRLGVPCFRGSLENTRLRYLLGAKHFNVDIICRVCGDSPFVDVACLDGMLVMARNGGVDYLRVTDTLNGFISEVFTLEALERSMFLDDSPTAREHVTPALSNRSDIFRHYLYPGPPVPSGYSFPQLTVDTADDLYIVRRMYAGGVTYHTKAHDILKVLQKTPPYSQAASL